MRTDAVPSDVQNLIACKCTKGCNVRCGCKNSGLKCSVTCKNCIGINYDNSANVAESVHYDFMWTRGNLIYFELCNVSENDISINSDVAV